MKRRKFLQVCAGGWAAAEAHRLTRPQPRVEKKRTSPDENVTDILILVLGTAQDGGIPHIGCYCPNCLAAQRDPKRARLIASLAILDFAAKVYLMIDATPDIRAQSDLAHRRLGLDISGGKNAPDGILLTHAHIGHYTGLMFYGYEGLHAEQLPVFASERMRRFLSANAPWSQLVDYKNISLRPLKPGEFTALTERISVKPFCVPHRDEFSDTLGLLISGPNKRLLYIPDIQSWEAWDRPVAEEVSRVDFALLDGTFFSPEELPGRDLSKIGHPFITSSMDALCNTVSREKTKVYFTHLNHTNLALDPEGEARKTLAAGKFALAAEGMEFIL